MLGTLSNHNHPRSSSHHNTFYTPLALSLNRPTTPGGDHRDPEVEVQSVWQGRRGKPRLRQQRLPKSHRGGVGPSLPSAPPPTPH